MPRHFYSAEPLLSAPPSNWLGTKSVAQDLQDQFPPPGRLPLRFKRSLPTVAEGRLSFNSSRWFTTTRSEAGFARAGRPRERALT